MGDKVLRSLLVALPILFCGCEEDTGDPPVISDLELDPQEVEVGEMTNVNADFTFEDPDGDVSEMVVTLTQGGQPTEMTAPLVAGGGLTSGPGRLILVLLASAPGDIDIDLRVRDEGGNESNTLSGQLTAVAGSDEDCESGGCAYAQLEVWLENP